MSSQLQSSQASTRGVTSSECNAAASSSVVQELDIKVVCVGAANTGKTTFLRRWESGESPLRVSTTIQMEFHRREMSIAVPPPAYFEQRRRWTAAEAGSLSASRDGSASARGNNSGCSGNGDDTASISSQCHHHHHHPDHHHHHELPTIRPIPSSTPRASSEATSGGYASLPNPFGDEYAITPPRLPPFYYSASAGRDNRTDDNATESGEAWPLVQIPAIVKAWDIQGQENTKRMTRIFYTGAVAVLIFCEIGSSMDSLTSALSWKSDVEQKIFISNTKAPRRGASIIGDKPQQPHERGEEEANPPCWLIVNKYDLLATLPSPPSWASRSALDELCAQHGFAGWSYAVGRKGVNVESIVCAVIAAAVDRFPQRLCGEWADDSTVIPRTRSRSQQRRGGGCCSK